MKATLLDYLLLGGCFFIIIEIIRRYKKKSPQRSLKGKLNSIVDSIRDYYLDDEITDTDFVFKCKVCGQVLHPKAGCDDPTVRGSWQCPNGCKPEN